MVKAAKPIVAAINGVAVGEGLTRTLPCDVRIASESARLSFRFVRVGLTPEFASTHYAPHLIGLGRTLEYMLRANLIPADEALSAGLVNYVYPDDEMLDKAVELAAEIADNPIWQLAQVKKLVHQDYLERDVDKVQADEGVIFRTAMGTAGPQRSPASIPRKATAQLQSLVVAEASTKLRILPTVIPAHAGIHEVTRRSAVSIGRQSSFVILDSR